MVYLRDACRDAPDLRSQVEALLRASQQSVDAFRTKPSQGETILVQDDIAEGPGSAIGRYKLLQKIGEGGMGAVFMAEQTEPVRRKVALKIIKLGMDTKTVVARFEAERQALALMDHPSIAKVLDAGETETGRPYFVMELVKGVPINVYCDKARLGMQARLKLFMQVCHAIQHAHQKGVIHRDIKPSNVLVTLNSGTPHPIVIDFGVAKATNQRLTEKTLFTNFAQMIGTPAYMSPEQAEMSQLDVDTRSDIYSLGVLLYELLTDSTPFPEKELLSQGYGEMQRILAEQEPERPSLRLSTLEGDQLEVVATSRRDQVPAMAKQIRGDLDWIVLKALDKDRNRRYGTASGLADDIQRHLKAEPVLAAKPTVIYQLTKVFRRHKPAIAAAAGIFLALLVGLVASLNQASRAQRALDVAVEAKAEAEQATRSEEALRREAELQSELARKLAEEQRLSAYLGDVRAANDAVENNEFNRARELLVAHKPGPSQADYRGIEWRYLWHASRDRSIARTKLEMQPKIKSSKLMELSPDRRFLAIQDSSASVRILDYSSLKEVSLIPFDQDYDSISMRFSPDNSRFYVRFRIKLVERTESSPASWQKGVHIYDTSTWSLVTTANPGPSIGFPLNEETWVMYNMHAGPAYDPTREDLDFVAFNPHDDGSLDMRPVLQNVSGRTDSRRPAGIGRLAVRRQDVDRDKSEGYLWQVWDTSELKEGTLIGGFTSNGFPVFGSRGRFYFTSQYLGSDVSSLKLFGFEEKSEIELMPGALTLEVDYEDVSFSDDSRWLVAMGVSGRIHVWSTESGDYAGFIRGHVDMSSHMVVGGRRSRLFET